jgi:hypothetical protein
MQLRQVVVVISQVLQGESHLVHKLEFESRKYPIPQKERHLESLVKNLNPSKVYSAELKVRG